MPRELTEREEFLLRVERYYEKEYARVLWEQWLRHKENRADSL